MVVDRGGLRYPIEVVDLFSANLAKFRASVQAARTEVARLRAAARQAINLRAQVSRAQTGGGGAAQAQRQANQAQLQRLRHLQAEIQQQKALDRIRAQAFKDQAQQLKAQNVALAASAKSSATLNQNLRQAPQAVARLNQGLGQTQNQASRLLFTFRRLVGVLALFTLARQAAAGFAQLIRSGFQFNQTLEQSRLGIAGIITSVAEVRNEQGQLLQGAEAFVAAQTAARRQIALLRRDALATTATFQELLEAFQIAVGPGLAAGFNLDQVRQFAVLISQAASNIGLPQRQLSEEIRAILTGNIRATTTRIAQVLNLTNAEIRRLKASGADVFFAELQNRLQGFALGAQSAAQTLGGLARRLQDVIELVAGRAASGAFRTLRDTFEELFEGLTVPEKTKFGTLLQPDPRAQAAFEEIFGAIERIIRRIRDLGRDIGLEGLIVAARVLSNVLETIAGFVLGIVDGIRLVSQFVGALLGPFIQLVGGSRELNLSMAEIARIMGNILALTIAIQAASAAWNFVVRGLVVSTTALSAATAATDAAARSSRLAFVRVGLVIGALGLGFQQLFKAITGLDVTFADTLAIIRLSFIEAFTRMASGIKIAFKEVANTIVGIFGNPLAEVARLVQKLLINPLLGAAAALAAITPGSFGRGIETARVKLEDLVAGIEQSIDRLNADRKPLFDTNQDQVELDKFLENSRKAFEKLRAEIAARGVIGPGFFPEGKEPKIRGKEIQIEFTATLDILRGAITSFSQFVSDSIVDAFDPTKDFDIRERFARFLQELARLIIQQLVQLAIAKALILGGVSPQGLPGVGAVVTKAEGGRIPDRRAQASLAHYLHPQGLAGGGRPKPPKGVDRRDTVPIWAQPGEFMMKLDAVRKYGLQTMEAINRGLLDPSQLRVMSGSSRLTRSRRQVRGFQSGGEIPIAVRQAGNEALQGRQAASNPALGAALLVANEQTADRLLAGGRKAMLDFIEEHGSDIEGRLARFRST